MKYLFRRPHTMRTKAGLAFWWAAKAGLAFWWAALVTLALLLNAARGSRHVSAFSLAGCVQQAEVVSLKFDQAVTGKLAGGEVRRYQIAVAAQQFIRVQVEQRGIDVVVRLLDASGKHLIEVDRPNGSNGTEELSWLTQAAATLTVEIAALEERAAPGDYEVRWREQRAPQPNDTQRIAAQAAMAAGNRIRAGGKETEHRQAIEQYTTASNAYQALAERENEAYARWMWGLTLSDLDEKDAAAEQYRAALALWQTIGNRAMQQSVQQSLNALAETTKIPQITPSAGDRAYAEADALYSQQSAAAYQQAILKFRQAAELYHAEGSSAKEALTLHNAGVVSYLLGEQQEALKYYNLALSLYRTVGDQRGEASTLSNLGNIYSALGKKEEALKYYNFALHLKRAVGDRSGEAVTLNNLGTVYDDLGEKQEALEHYNLALPLYRRVGDISGEARALNNLGSVCFALGEKQEALKYYNLAFVPWATGAARRWHSTIWGELTTIWGKNRKRWSITT